MVKTAVILAAGVNARLNSRIKNIPKGFIRIDNTPMIERSLQILFANNIEKIIIGTGYLCEHYQHLAAKYHGVMTQNNDLYETTGSFYTLYSLQNIIDDDFLLLESDLIYENRAVKHLQDNILRDTILASGRTYSGDEVYIEVDQDEMLIKMSKKEAELNSIFGELVGISKISIQTYRHVCALFEGLGDKLRTIAYEYAFTELSQTHPIKIERIEDLVWAEIDTPDHLKRVKEIIYPRLQKLQLKSY